MAELTREETLAARQKARAERLAKETPESRQAKKDAHQASKKKVS